MRNVDRNVCIKLRISDSGLFSNASFEIMPRKIISSKLSKLSFARFVFKRLQNRHPGIRISSLDMPPEILQMNSDLKNVLITSSIFASSKARVSISAVELRGAVYHRFSLLKAEEIHAFCSKAAERYGIYIPVQYIKIRDTLKRLNYSKYLSNDGLLYLCALITWRADSAIDSAVNSYLKEEGLISFFEE